MRFANWNVTETTIEWSGTGFNRFVIEKEQLLEIEKVEVLKADFYRWIILATNEDWLTDDDLYDLNFAFVFAAGAWSLNFDYELFDKTVEHQFNMLDDEEEFEP